MENYLPMLGDAFGMFLFLGIELSVLFLLISYGVGLLQQYIPDSKVQSILSDKGGRAYIFAALLGAVTPFCSCSTIPMLRGLLKAKAGFGPTLTFLFTSPLLNPIIIGLFLATFGMRITIYYVVIALGVSVIAGLVLNMLKFERYIIPETHFPESCGCNKQTNEISEMSCSCIAPEPAGCNCITPAAASSCCGSSASPHAITPTSFKSKSRFAFKEAFHQFKTVSPYLLLGVALGAFVYGFVPSDFIAQYASGDNWYSIPIAAIIGIPLYVRTEVLIPLSAALANKGMGLGAIMALIIGGGGASITEVILLKSMFRMPMIIAFLVVILGMAVFAGTLFQYVL